MITYHPETYSIKESFSGLKNLLKYLKKVTNIDFIFTSNNTDEYGQIFLKEINKFCTNNNHARIIKNFGSHYHSVAKHSLAVIGNSSSGVIEIPYLNILTLNIGSSQEGREIPDSVINCSNSYNSIEKGFKTLFQELKSNKKRKKTNNPKKNNAIKFIVDKLIKIVKSKNLNSRKEFYDILTN